MHKLTIQPSDVIKREKVLFNFFILSSITVTLYLVGKAIRHSDIALFWPLNAVIVGLFIRHKALRYKKYAAVVLAAMLLSSFATGERGVYSILVDFSDVLFMLIMYWLIIREEKADEDNLKITIFRIYSYCFISALLCSALGSYIYSCGIHAEFWQIYPVWFSEEFTTSVLILPFTLLCQKKEFFSPLTLRRLVPVGMLMASLLVSILSGVTGSMGTLAMILPALIWCALNYSLSTTCLLTLCSGMVEMMLIDRHAIESNMTSFLPMIISTRLGIASIAISPVIVAVSVEAVNKMVKQLSRQVRYDYLTRVHSRFGLYEHLRELEVTDNETSLNVLVLDIDHFKKINDTWGHDCGDNVLMTFARRVKNTVADRGVIARLGGEEFAVVMTGKPGEDGYRLAEDIRQAIEEMNIAWQSANLSLTVSIGLSYGQVMRWNIVDSFDRLLSEADSYLYQSKKTGRNRISASPLINNNVTGS
ncbi:MULTISPECIES: GGDEF domain-containing protein [Klebsiella]|jgi:diguanylate cyclase (GGDEF) domain|uniref:GGDEF domain-containing protein n=1 Tax=Klebsiella TaxID=570 RepID=UPI00069BC202|nr:GGDEF domain-containing protein [Klebsiella aerogenes]EIW9476399.1 diguanylate cyclase [Klebsiella aerogenes]EIW9496602.1 diguanylate cyclase [Klebsiella aerogenes]EKM7512109.1 diguanylate cyclase [Klebsiella aerogenes]EKV8808515.1 diguanylate cyclase [Klebsiella aerogenes]ELJ2005759.1 diguanylate cyclase [Klebsiella aerogenes]